MFSRVGLDQIREHAAVVADGAAQGRNHARGHRMVEAEGVADGDDGFAGHDVGGVAQTHGGKVARAFDFQHGNVEIRFRAFDRGGKFAPVQQMDHDFVAARDDVGVGQHQTLWAVHNDAGPQADALLPSGPRAGKAVKTRKTGAEAGAEKAFQR